MNSNDHNSDRSWTTKNKQQTTSSVVRRRVLITQVQLSQCVAIAPVAAATTGSAILTKTTLPITNNSDNSKQWQHSATIVAEAVVVVLTFTFVRVKFCQRVFAGHAKQQANNNNDNNNNHDDDDDDDDDDSKSNQERYSKQQ